jgi:hypothetical protein
MRFGLLALIAALGCASASAHALPLQGSVTTFSGRAHVVQKGDSTYVTLDGPSSGTGVVAFGNKSTFPDIFQLHGRNLQITGVVNVNGRITLTDPRQIRVAE